MGTEVGKDLADIRGKIAELVTTPRTVLTFLTKSVGDQIALAFREKNSQARNLENIQPIFWPEFKCEDFAVGPARVVLKGPLVEKGFGLVPGRRHIGRKKRCHLDFLAALVPHYGDDRWFNGHYAMALSEPAACVAVHSR
jgi:hypothetical protein